MAVQWYQAELLRIETFTPNTRNFVFKFLTEEPIAYAPGQFFIFDLPLGEKRAQRWRSYTVAKAFDGSNTIECCISFKENGLASQYFFHTIQVGDIVRLKGPEGTFILPENTANHLFFIGTGTGMAPYRAMLQEIYKKNLKYSSVHWIFGSRKKEDLLYQEDLNNWIEIIPNLHVDICLSKESQPPLDNGRWKYHAAHVHHAYIQKLNKEYSADRGDLLFYLCGWSGMIDQAVAHLLQDFTIDRTQIKFELYG